MINTNYLVIGSGIAGLTFAVKIAEKYPDRSVVIITKSTEEESNTKYAQGGVSIVLDHDKDSFKKHIEDTLIAGDGLCNEAVVEMVVKEGPARLKELLIWGANFDKDSHGNLDLGKEGGHSENRIVHHKDITGYEIERALLERAHQLENIRLLPHFFAIDLITNHHVKDKNTATNTCYGAYVLDQKKNTIITIKSDSTLLASGGVGRVYGHTTNPIIATGDGIAMAYRAKTKISDMEFIQFHPTAMYDVRGGRSSFLISEAVRGFGAYLRNEKGHRFMPDYDDRAELASRDIVSQCIDNELKKTGGTHVFLDCTHLDMPAFIATTQAITIPNWNDEGTIIPEEHIVIKHNLEELQALMRDYVGIVRSDSRLKAAIKRLDLIYNEVEDFYKQSKITASLCELRNMVNVAHLIISQSIARKENKGGFYNKDIAKN